MRLVSIAEEVSLGLLVEATERVLPQGTVMRALWDFQREATDTWPQRLGVWKRVHSITVGASFQRYGEFVGFVEARNAIVHGLGSLTEKQMRDRERTVARLRGARIPVTGTRLGLHRFHVDLCASVVREFIVWLDGEAAAIAAH